MQPGDWVRVWQLKNPGSIPGRGNTFMFLLKIRRLSSFLSSEFPMVMRLGYKSERTLYQLAILKVGGTITSTSPCAFMMSQGRLYSYHY